MHRFLIAATLGITLLSAAGAVSAASARSMTPQATPPAHGEQGHVTPAHYNGYYGYYAPPRYWHRHHHHHHGYGYGEQNGYGRYGRGWR